MPTETGPTPELYFATVRAIGTPLQKTIVDPLVNALQCANFHLESQKLSDRLYELEPTSSVLSGLIPKPNVSGTNRYLALMNVGDYIRSATQRSDAVLMEGLRYLNSRGRELARAEATTKGRRGIAYLFRNLMHPAEVTRLRKLYDRQLFVLSIFSSETKRREHLEDALAGDRHKAQQFGDSAATLMAREAGLGLPAAMFEPDVSRSRRFRLNIPRTFEHGDLFLDIEDHAGLPQQIERFVDLIFGHPFHTPTPDEIGMADAFGAELQSGNLARQVGAAICSEVGELLTTGTNDVPKAGGGVYREADIPDNRDYNSGEWGYDPSDRTRRQVLADLVERMLADPLWLKQLDVLIPRFGETKPAHALAMALELARADEGPLHDRSLLEDLVDSIVTSQIIRAGQFFDVIEYGRTMHAEMDAITSAARKGVSIRGATLYCTTLPCHECTRLIIGSGIKRVIFIEPYEKSRFNELYRSEVRITTLAESRRASDPNRIDFVPYVGISPKRFNELFSWVPRKAEDVDTHAGRPLMGNARDWLTERSSSKVREGIISESALNSTGRLNDLIEHEAELIDEYRSDYVSVMEMMERMAAEP
jgi:cytidine deaminase